MKMDVNKKYDIVHINSSFGSWSINRREPLTFERRVEGRSCPLDGTIAS
jgi:hypothetical protein